MSYKIRGGNIFNSKVLARFALIFSPLPKRSFCSIDVTSHCNLRCSHCYHFAHEQPSEKELTLKEWIGRIEDMQKKKPYFSCTWVGGEPLLRQEIIEKGRKYFSSNRVVTNGTIELPNWPDVDFHISVDGTEPLHNKIRGKDCYSRIKRNLEKASHKNLKVIIACCLNRENIHCMEDVVVDWYGVPNVKSVLFDFLTPSKGEKNENLWLSFEERDAAILRLNSLKRRYGDFIGVPPATFNLMKSEVSHKSIGKNCVYVKNGLALDAWGNKKNPCVMGPKADCHRCGCIVPFSVRAWKKPANLLREILKAVTIN